MIKITIFILTIFSITFNIDRAMSQDIQHVKIDTNTQEKSLESKKHDFFDSDYSDVKIISMTSFLTAIIFGIQTAHDNNIKIPSDDFLGLRFLMPILTTPGISIILGIILSKKISLINFLLPPYIAIPTFYSTWLATHLLLQYSIQ